MTSILDFLIKAVCIGCFVVTGFANEDNSRNVDFKEIFQNAELANATYQSEAEIHRFSETLGVELTAHETIEDIQIACFLITDTKTQQQTIAVRGTSNIENAMIDVSLKLVFDEKSQLYLHEGFSQSARKIYSALKPHLRKGFKVNTTGHSLGGAVAMILAIYLHQDDYEVGKTITFGQPKVTNLAGASSFTGLDIIRVVNARDLVPLVPFIDPLDINDVDIFWHAGREVILLEDSEYAILEGMDSMLRATRFTREPLDEGNVIHHKMTTYVDAIGRRTDQSRLVDYESGFSLFDLFGD